MTDGKRFRIARVFHWLLGAVLIWASLSKLGDLQSFYGTLLAYQLPLPDFMLRLVAQILPWLEFFCGLMLLVNFRTDAALFLWAALFAVFVAVTAQAWLRGLDISCGCLDLRLFGLKEGGRIAQWLSSTTFAFWRALLLLLIAAPLAYQELRKPIMLEVTG